MRKHLAIALLEAEALEPRIQLAYARSEIPDAMPSRHSIVIPTPSSEGTKQ